MVTDQQVLLLRRRIMEGKSQQASAAAAGMSARSARRWQRGPLPSDKNRRSWRTRPDAFAEVWEEEIVPLLRRDARKKLQATVLLEWLDGPASGQVQRISPAHVAAEDAGLARAERPGPRGVLRAGASAGT